MTVEPEQLKVNEDVDVRAWVRLGELNRKMVVQLYYGSLDSRQNILDGGTIDMLHCCPDDKASEGNVHEFLRHAQLRDDRPARRHGPRAAQPQ